MGLRPSFPVVPLFAALLLLFAVIPSAARDLLFAAMTTTYYVYILASRSRAIYVGMTNDLTRRVFEHRSHAVPGHTAHYRLTRLVYFETTDSPYAAIAREKQIKGWRRDEKVALVEQGNPTWEDLAANWFEGGTAGPSLRSG